MASRPPAARTAFGPIMIIAVEQHIPAPQRLVTDDLAIRFLLAGARAIVGACRFRPLRDVLIRASEQRLPGLWAEMLCRKRHADERVAEALAAGIDQVVFLGAGLDTRACRLVAPAGARAFEVDLPANSAYKRDRLRAIYGRVPERVRLIPLDFETGDLAAALAANGFQTGRPALFVWEAVTQYLTEDGFRRTLGFLAGSAAGSRLIFTYVLKDFVDGVNRYGAERAYQDFVVKQRIWHLGLDPDGVAGLLAEYGWAEREQVGRPEYVARYLEPAGRDLPVTEIERFVYAEKLP